MAACAPVTLAAAGTSEASDAAAKAVQMLREVRSTRVALADVATWLARDRASGLSPQERERAGSETGRLQAAHGAAAPANSVTFSRAERSVPRPPAPAPAPTSSLPPGATRISKTRWRQRLAC